MSSTTAPSLRPTVFPDAAVAATVAELRDAAAWLARADDERVALAAAELADWAGGFRTRFDLDAAAGHRAAAELVRQLHAAADELEAAATQVHRLRARRMDDLAL